MFAVSAAEIKLSSRPNPFVISVGNVAQNWIPYQFRRQIGLQIFMLPQKDQKTCNPYETDHEFCVEIETLKITFRFN